MLQQISWSQYAETIGISLAAYYIVIGLKFYRADIRQFLSGQRKPKARTLSNDNSAELDEEQDTAEDNGEDLSRYFPAAKNQADDLVEQAESLTPKIKEAIAVAAEKEYVQEEFIQSLQKLLKQYTSLNIPAYRVAINNLIASECDKHGNLHLGADELNMLWLE